MNNSLDTKDTARTEVYARTYGGSFWVTALTPGQHEKTCGYWYTVTNRAMALTAFKTWDGLVQWMAVHGLWIEGDIPAFQSGKSAKIEGEYREHCHMSHTTLPTEGRIVAQMDNGQYTEGRAILEADGIVTVHYANCNDKERVILDYWKTRFLTS